jgi:glyoxylase-like metal-dependent hydrolase (beta-lactamase superfamily II)
MALFCDTLLDGMKELLKGLFAFDPNPLTHGSVAWLVRGPSGAVLIDPPVLSEAHLSFIRSQGPVLMFVTHQDGLAGVREFRAALDVPVAMHVSEAHLLGGAVDMPFDDDLDLLPGVRAIHTPGHSPGSSCLLVDVLGGVLFTGDHLLVQGKQGVRMVNFDWTWDWAAQCRSARKLLRYEFEYIASGHSGTQILDDAKSRLRDALARDTYRVR